MKPFERTYLRAMLWFSMIVMLAAVGIAQAAADDGAADESATASESR